MGKKDQGQDNHLIALQKAIAELLQAQGIHPVLDYGWANEDMPDEDYIGLAMWTSDAPFQLRWDSWKQDSPPPRPTPSDEAFYKAGEDFFGTMELARNALGVALYSYEHRRTDDLIDDDDSFWEHTAIASVWLNIAADRVRDYFLAARFAMTAKEYKKGRPRADYLRPFLEADPEETANAATALTELQLDARKLEHRRSDRNQIVHTVTSRQGKRAVEAIRRQREASNPKLCQPRRIEDFLTRTENWDESVKALEEERKAKLLKELEDLKEWYRLLVHASARVFEYEYWRRIKK